MMGPFEYIVIGLGIAILGSNWRLHRDIADLRERIAKLEGLFEGHIGAHAHDGGGHGS